MSEIGAPLSRRKASAAVGSARRQLPIARLALAAIATLLLAAALRILLVETPDGGRPFAEVPINNTQNANPVAGANRSAAMTGSPGKAAQIAPASEAPAVPSAEGAAPSGGGVEAAIAASGNLPDLAELTDRGPIPRISSTGVTPFAAYARPAPPPASASGRPRIAIIVTGLGVNVAGTMDAIEKLPEAVTLAFSPYGKALERTVGGARAEGHEIFLEVPLEPFDYPENDPGPDTLITGQAPRDNMDRLYAVMTKFGGYAGLINNMGARFTASGADFGPMMEELGARGLGFLDDGSSSRSLAPQLAKANRVPFNRADLRLDEDAAPAPILRALGELEAKARQRGAAIGVMSALPVSVRTLAAWERGLEQKGIILVPASALMQ